MCGRVFRQSSWGQIQESVNFSDPGRAPNLGPSWNIPPTSDMMVCALGKSGERTPIVMKWGLIPRWSKDGKFGYGTHNARSETIDTKPTFKPSWEAARRCLVLIDGYYEWKAPPAGSKQKQPYAFALHGTRQGRSNIMAMAGLWDQWKDPFSSAITLSCTIATTTPNEAAARIHDRMPVILEKADWPLWLGEIEGADLGDVKALLKPCSDEVLDIWPVATEVGRVANDGRHLIEVVNLPGEGMLPLNSL